MRSLLALVLLLGFGTAASAAVPSRMNYQGRLLDSAGLPVNNPALGLTFRIFDAPGGGTQLWTELQTVAVSGGLFNVELGAVTPLNTPVFTGLQPWLEMQVAGDPSPLTPRARLVTAPYAHVASTLAAPAELGGASATWVLSVTNNGSGEAIVGTVNAAGFNRSGVLGIARGGGQSTGVTGDDQTGNPSSSGVRGLSGEGFGLSGLSGGLAGAGVLAENSGGGADLLLGGTGRIDSAGNTIFMARYVSFAAGTNLGSGVSAPLSLSLNAALSAPLYVINTGGAAAVSANATSGAALYGLATGGSGLGLLAQNTAFGGTAARIDNLGGGGASAGLVVTGVNALSVTGGATGLPALVARNAPAAVGAFPIYGINTGTSGNSPAIVAEGVVLGLSATASGSSGVAGHFQAVSAVVGLGSSLGLYGANTTAVPPSIAGGAGVYGFSVAGSGVFGRNSSAGSGKGVEGYAAGTSSGAVGVYGYAAASGGAAAGAGVHGRSDGDNGRGVYGFASSGTGANIGVHGQSGSSAGTGVLAEGAAGGFALKVSGNARFDGGGNTATFFSYVSFAAGTNLGSAIPIPLNLSGANAYPGAILTGSNTGSGHGVAGYANVPGEEAPGGPTLTTQLSAGVAGFSSASSSAGVLGRSSLTYSAGAGVGGIGYTGVVGFGRGDVAGSAGGSFSSSASNGIGAFAVAVSGTGISAQGLTGVAVSVQQPGGVGLVIGTVAGAKALLAMGSNNYGENFAQIVQTGSVNGGTALGVYSYATSSAAVAGVSYDSNPPGPAGAGAGVSGQGPIGVAGGSSVPGGIGLYGAAGPSGVGVYAFGGVALRVSGNAQFDGAGNTVTFNSYVSFTAGTNLALGGVSAPLTLTSAGAGSTFSSFNTGGSSTGHAVQAQVSSTARAVQAVNLGGGQGVYGESTSIGVYGVSTGSGYGLAGYSTTGIGVRGDSTNDKGVNGFSSNNIGVYGQTASSTNGSGVAGYTSGNGWGVQGWADGSFTTQNGGVYGRYGVGTSFGEPVLANGVGVVGLNDMPNGYGGYFRATNTAGTGKGLVAWGNAVGVSATADGFSGTAGHFQGATGVAVYASNMPIHAVNTAGGGFLPAIFAEVVNTNTGVIARNTANGNQGSLAGPVDLAHFEMGVGVQGVSQGNPGNVGVHGFSAQGPGVRGDGDTGVAGYVTSSTGTALYGDASGRIAAKALHTLGNTQFDGLGNTATFNIYVSFTAGTNLVASVAAPLSLTHGSSSVVFADSTGANHAIYGRAGSGLAAGVVGQATGGGKGVYGFSTNAGGGWAIYGEHLGTGIGVYALSTGTAGKAIEAWGGAFGVSASAKGPNGVGGYFQGVTGLVVAGNPVGISVTAVGGSSIPLYARGSNGTTVIEAIQDSGSDAVRATANSGIAVNAFSGAAGGYAVFARNTVGKAGAFGGGTIGLSATASSGGGVGVYARVNGSGRAGYFEQDGTGGYGVEIQSSETALYANSSFGGFPAVYARSGNGSALTADGANLGISVTARNAGSNAIYARINSGNEVINATNDGTGALLGGQSAGTAVNANKFGTGVDGYGVRGDACCFPRVNSAGVFGSWAGGGHTAVAGGAGVIGANPSSGGIGVMGEAGAGNGLGVLALNPATLGGGTGAALFVSGSAKFSGGLFSEPFLANPWTVNGGVPLPFGPSGQVRNSGGAQNVSRFTVMHPMVTDKSVVLVNIVLGTVDASASSLVYVYNGSFTVSWGGPVSFLTGDGFNFLILN